MSVEIVRVEDYQKIAKKNEYFFWHFTNTKLKRLVLQPYFDKFENRKHELKELVDLTNIPYFESNVEDSFDFILKLEPRFHKAIYGPNKGVYNPVILSFKRKRLLYNTWDICYCPEGFIELILKTNPKFIESLDLND